MSTCNWRRRERTGADECCIRPASTHDTSQVAQRTRVHSSSKQCEPLAIGRAYSLARLRSFVVVYFQEGQLCCYGRNPEGAKFGGQGRRTRSAAPRWPCRRCCMSCRTTCSTQPSPTLMPRPIRSRCRLPPARPCPLRRRVLRAVACARAALPRRTNKRCTLRSGGGGGA